MPRRSLLLALSGLALLALIAALGWLLIGSGGGFHARSLSSGSNAALDVRYSYDNVLFQATPYVGNAEFPLQLDAKAGKSAQPFSLYGKRIRGLAKLLKKDPTAMLFDFIGQQNDSVFEEWYKLKPLKKPDYEDVTIQRKLGLHQRLVYAKGNMEWPPYFPAGVKQGDKVHIEGWTFFSDKDLFFFYAIAAEPLTPRSRAACLAVMNSLKFNVTSSK
jgi:hypothetical protein